MNPLTDGWEFRWNVLVALDGVDAAALDAALGSLDTAASNTVVRLQDGSPCPGTPPTRNLAYAVSVPVRELTDGMDVAVVSGDALTALAALLRGVPVVVLPASRSDRETGRQLVAAGLGVVVDDPGDVGGAVRRVVEDGAMQRAARRAAGRLAVVDALLVVLATRQLPLVRATKGD